VLSPRATLAVSTLAALALGLAYAPAARAQAPIEEEDPTALEAPRLVEAPLPEFPVGEVRAATVHLTLVVDAEGRVREVRAAEGDAPFVDLARRAAEGFRFEPARRGAVAVTVVVRVDVEFTPPPEPTPGPPEPEPPPHAAAPEAPVQDVVVQGEKQPRGKRPALGKTELRQLPGALGDPLRAVEVLPGVIPTVSGLPYFYVRGAPPNSTAFYLDDLRLPYLFHVGLGPSSVHPSLVRSVDLLPAATDPELGRVVGAFVRAGLREPSDRLTFDSRVRALDASSFVEAPIGERWHVAAGGLASYTKPLLSLFAPEFTIDYRDAQSRVVWDPTPRDRLTLLAFGSYDFASQVEDGAERVLFASELYRADLRWDRDLGPRQKLRVGATAGYDRSRLVGKRFARDFSVAARARYTTPLGDDVDLKTGADLRADDYGADLPSEHALTRADYEETKRVLGDRTDLETGAYATVVYRPTRRAELLAGARFDLYRSLGVTAPALEPRTAFAYEVAPYLRLRTEHGIAHQPPAYSLPIPALAIGGLPGGLQESFQSSVTSEVALPARLLLAATAFRSAFSNLSDFVLLQSDFPFRPTAPASGLTVGGEVALSRPVRDHWGLQVSYTLSRSTRGPARGGTELSPYDRTHVLNLALMFDLGRGWNLGGRFLLYTGLPERPANLDGPRLPTFHRIDARLAKRWTIGKTGYVGVVLEGINVTARTETIGITCTDGPCRPRTLAPLVMPSLGLEGGM